MSINPFNRVGLTGNDSGTGSEIEERVRERARELALLAGRPLGHVTPADFEQAKRELLSGLEQKTGKTLMESAPGSSQQEAPGSWAKDKA